MAFLPPLLRSCTLLLLSAAAFATNAAPIPLEPREGQNTPHHAAERQIAFNGDRFLVTWVEQREASLFAVMGRLLDRAGDPISERPFLITTLTHGFVYDVQLIAAEESFALFYTLDSFPRMLRISADGQLLDERTVDIAGYTCNASRTGQFACSGYIGSWQSHPAVVILNEDGSVRGGPYAVGEATDREPQVIASHGDFLALSTTSGVAVARVTGNGVGPRLELTHKPAQYEVVAAEGENGATLLIWSENRVANALRFARISADLSAFTTHEMLIDSAGAVPRALVAEGDGYLLYYSTGTYAEERHLRVIPLDANGHRSGEPRVLGPIDGLSEVAVAASDAAAVSLALGGDRGVVVTSFDHAGPSGTTRHLSLGPERQGAPLLGSGNGRALAVLTTRSGLTESVRGGYVDHNGPVTWGELTPQTLATRELPRNWSEYLLLHRQDKRLYATTISHDGVATGDPVFVGEMSTDLDDVEAEPAAVWAGGHWAVVWPRASGHFSYAAITLEGVVSEPRELIPNVPLPPGYSRWFRNLALSWDGINLLLAWAQYQPPPCMQPECAQGPLEVYATRLTMAGDFIDMPMKVDAGGGDIDAEATLSIATNGYGFLVTASATATLLDTHLGALRVAQITPLASSGVASDVTWDGRDYVIAYRRRVSTDQWRLVVMRLDAHGTFKRSLETGTRAPGSEADSPPSITAIWPGETLIALQEADFLSGAGAYLYRESDLLPQPPRLRRRASR